MADFSLSQIGDVAPSGPQPRAGVAGPSATVAASQFLAGAASSLFQAFEQREAEEQKAQSQQAIARFSQQQVALADAVDRGDLTSQEARMQMRANYSAALSDNPALTEDLSKAHANIIETAGLGKVAAEGTEKEQAFYKALNEATQEGWVSPNMSEDEAWEATMARLEFKRQQERIDAETNLLQLKRARVGLQKDVVQLGTARIAQGTASINQQNAALKLQQNKAQIASQQAVGAMADAYTTRLRTKSNAIQAQIEAGEIDPVEGARMLDDEWLGVQATVAQAGRQAGGTYVSNLTAPMRDFYEAHRARITGEIDAATMNSVTENALARQTMNMTGDPETARILATSKLVGQSGNLALSGPLQKVALDALNKNGTEEGRAADLTDPASEEGSQQYLMLLKESTSKAVRGGFVGNEEAAQEDVRVNINQVLKGMGDYGNLVDNPSQLNNLMEFLSSDDYGSYVEREGTAINQDNMSSARNVVETQFDQQVRPLIQEEWNKANITTSALPTSGVLGTTGEEEQATNLIQPVFSGNGVRFVASDDRNLPRVQAQLANLNNRVAPVVNRLIKAGAHLQGNKDYQKFYEQNYAELFGDSGESNE